MATNCNDYDYDYDCDYDYDYDYDYDDDDDYYYYYVSLSLPVAPGLNSIRTWLTSVGLNGGVLWGWRITDTWRQVAKTNALA